MITITSDFDLSPEWNFPYATNEAEGELSFLLDELERAEVYLNSNTCSSDEVSDCQEEIETLNERIDALEVFA